RLARARDVLRKRLSRRGLGLSSGLLTTLLSQNALSAALPFPLVRATTQAALLIAAGRTVAASAVSAPVAALTEGVPRAMLMTKLKMAAAWLLALSLVGMTAGLLTHQALAARQGEALSAPPQQGAQP